MRTIKSIPSWQKVNLCRHSADELYIIINVLAVVCLVAHEAKVAFDVLDGLAEAPRFAPDHCVTCAGANLCFVGKVIHWRKNWMAIVWQTDTAQLALFHMYSRIKYFVLNADACQNLF